MLNLSVASVFAEMALMLPPRTWLSREKPPQCWQCNKAHIISTMTALIDSYGP